MTKVKFTEGLEAGEGLETRKVNSKFPAGGSVGVGEVGVEVGLGGKGGELGLPMPDCFSSSASEEEHIQAQKHTRIELNGAGNAQENGCLWKVPLHSKKDTK